MSVKHELRRLLWKFGYDLSKFTPTSNPLARRKQLFRSYAIDTVLDIGANAGKFAHELRHDIDYRNRILSFEPLSSAFRELQANAAQDPDWEVFNFALGDADEERTINIAGNSYSSSILDMLPSHLKSAPESEYVGKEMIHVRTLDSFFREKCAAGKSLYMKIDAQGYEERVLRGAEKSLACIDTIQTEVSLVPLYEGELLLTEMCTLLANKGYTLVAMENGFSDAASGQLLQVDGIFHRL